MIFEKQIVDSYRTMMFSRCDDTETVFYFSSADFEGMKREKYSFMSSLGHKLKGNIYYRDGYKEDRLVVFDHGFGSGHRAYMKEIDILTNAGYRVLAYDHTGCMESGGESPNGLAQSLCDLNDALNAVKADKELGALKISVMGHSWGAFSSMNICALHPDVTHVVALSGFVSVKMMVDSFFGGPLALYRKAVMRLEESSMPKFIGYSAAESLKNTNAKTLLIYSDNDVLVKLKHYNALKAALSDNKNVTLSLVHNKRHNPNYTAQAVEYLYEFGKARAELFKRRGLTKEEKAAFVSGYDFWRMTEQDSAVWQTILAHLEK